jgi:methyltransferase (TIGR00027 family)
VTSAFSQTAVLVAAYRARASARPNPICSDRWAAALSGDEGVELTASYDRVYPPGELYTAVRTAFIDAEVKAALRSGVRQVVILGAGMDTRAARLARPGVRFFEVDKAESQAEKLRRLRALDGYPVDAASYVACDFEKDDFVERLVAGGYSTTEAAFVVWEGVTLYLTEAAVRATLRRVTGGLHPSTTIIFDFVSKGLAQGRTQRAEDDAMRTWLASLGEPIIFGMNDPVPILYEEGFRHVRTVSFDEACLTMTGTYDRARMFRFQHLAMCSKAPPAKIDD